MRRPALVLALVLAGLAAGLDAAVAPFVVSFVADSVAGALDVAGTVGAFDVGAFDVAAALAIQNRLKLLYRMEYLTSTINFIHHSFNMRE